MNIGHWCWRLGRWCSLSSAVLPSVSARENRIHVVLERSRKGWNKEGLPSLAKRAKVRVRLDVAETGVAHAQLWFRPLCETG